MSRFPSATSPTVPLQVVADPVSAYAAPEIRAKASGSKLLQLALALRQVNPEVQGVIDRRTEAEIEQARRQASADVARLKLENREAFKSAVDAGLLPEIKNPHYADQLRQDVARHEARGVRVTAWKAYQGNTDVRFSDDLEKVGAFVEAQLAPLIEGRDSSELQAMLPLLHETKDSILAEHVRNRSVEVQRERRAAYETEVSAIVSGLSRETLDALENPEEDDTSSTERLSEVVRRLQGQLANTQSTVHSLTANQWTVQAIANVGLQRKDRRLARTILNQLTDRDGSRLGDSHETKTLLDSVEREIAQRERQDIREEREFEKLQEDQQYKTLANTFLSRVNDRLKEDPGASLHDVSLTVEELTDISPEVYARLIGLRQQALASQGNVASRPLLTKLFGAGLRGELDTKAKVDIYEALAALGHEPGIIGFLSAEDRMRNDAWGPTDPETEIALTDLARNGKLDLANINSAVRARRLSHQDFRYYSRLALEQMGGGASPFADDRYVQMLTSALSSRLIDSEGMDRNEVDEQFLNRLSVAKVEFLKASEQLVRQNPTLTYDEREKSLSDLLDSVSKKYGGFSWGEYQARAEQKAQAAKSTGQGRSPLAATAPLPATKPESLIPQAAQIGDPAVRNVVDDDQVTFRRVLSLRSIPDIEVQEPNLYEPRYELVQTWAKGELPLGSSGTRSIDRDPLGTLRAARRQELDLRESWSADFKEKWDRSTLGHWQAAVRRAQALKSVIEAQDVSGQYKALLNTVRERESEGNAFIRASEKRRLILLANVLMEYSQLRANAGYSLEEVKALGEGAWREVPMFANSFHLERTIRDAEAATKIVETLGLTTEQEKADFITAQRKLVPLLYESAKR